MPWFLSIKVTIQHCCFYHSICFYFLGLCFDMNPKLIHFHPPSFSPSILFSTFILPNFHLNIFKKKTQGYQYWLWFDTYKHFFGNFVKFVRNVTCRSWNLFQIVYKLIFVNVIAYQNMVTYLCPRLICEFF